MSLLVIDHPNAEIEHLNGLIRLRQADQMPKTIPIKHIDSLIVSQAQSLPVKLIQALSKEGKSIVCLDRLNSANSLVIQQTNVQSAERRVKHYKFSLDETSCLKHAKGLIQHKIKLQHQLLEEWLDTTPKHRHTLITTQKSLQSGLETLTTATSIDRLLGHEGHLQKTYFKAYFTLFTGDFSTTKRSRQPPKDPVNALLSLGYTLLYHDAVRACHKYGLDPYIGIYHQLTHSRYSLACDLMEPLRPAVDHLVRKLITEQEILYHHFGKRNTATHLTKEGRPRFFKAYHQQRETLCHQLNLYANHLARHIDQTELPKRYKSQHQGV
jgi:CRISPR-associated protein Cas1